MLFCYSQTIPLPISARIILSALNSSTYIRELYAIATAIKKWRQYLLGSRFTIQTDHKTLTHLMEQVVLTPEQQHYLSKLLGFEYTITYKPGKDNLVVDALSRQLNHPTAQFLGFSTPKFLFLYQLLHENQTYSDLIQLQKLIMADPSKYPDMHIRDGLLYKKGKLFISANSPLKQQLLHEFHSTPAGGHGGISKTSDRISSNFAWPGMHSDVTKFVQSCHLSANEIQYSTSCRLFTTSSYS